MGDPQARWLVDVMENMENRKQQWTGWWWLVAIFGIFPEILGFDHHPNWLSLHHFSGRGGQKPPTRIVHGLTSSLVYFSGRGGYTTTKQIMNRWFMVWRYHHGGENSRLVDFGRALKEYPLNSMNPIEWDIYIDPNRIWIPLQFLK